MATLITLAALWTAFIWMYRSEPRRLANAALLLPVVLLTLASLSDFASSVIPGAGLVMALLVVLLPLMVLIFAFVLLYNGVLMWRREGARLGNLLSLLAGMLVLVLPALAVLLVANGHWLAVSTAFVLFMASVYTAMVFVMVLLYAWVYARFPLRPAPAGIVVLGSRAIKGKVTPLLRGRLDKGIELYHSLNGQEPWMVPSGGKGPDEIEPEGASMGRYLTEQGISPDRILIEDRARDTIQNLKYSHELLSTRGAEGPLWVVTSDYHALRAALASHRLGIEAASFGGKTAGYYRPSAFLREFIAIARDHWRLFAVLALPFAGILAFGLIFSLN